MYTAKYSLPKSLFFVKRKREKERNRKTLSLQSYKREFEVNSHLSYCNGKPRKNKSLVAHDGGGGGITETYFTIKKGRKGKDSECYKLFCKRAENGWLRFCLGSVKNKHREFPS